MKVITSSANNDNVFLIYRTSGRDALIAIEYNIITYNTNSYLIHQDISNLKQSDIIYTFKNLFTTYLDFTFGIHLTDNQRNLINPTSVNISNIIDNLITKCPELSIKFRFYQDSISIIKYVINQDNKYMFNINFNKKITEISDMKLLKQFLIDNITENIITYNMLFDNKKWIDNAKFLFQFNLGIIDQSYHKAFISIIQQDLQYIDVKYYQQDINDWINYIIRLQQTSKTMPRPFVFRKNGFQLTIGNYQVECKLFGKRIKTLSFRNYYDEEDTIFNNLLAYGCHIGIYQDFVDRANRRILISL